MFLRFLDLPPPPFGHYSKGGYCAPNRSHLDCARRDRLLLSVRVAQRSGAYRERFSIHSSYRQNYSK